MKRIVLVLFACLFLFSCATISHKDIETSYKGFGVSVDYKSKVVIDAKDIPAFIRAVDKLEKLLRGE